MKLTIRLSLLISATALFASACTPVPMENQSTPYGSGSYNTTPAPAVNTNVSNAPVPEAGPLSETTYAANTPAQPQYPTAAAPQVPAATATPTPVATVPQVPAATHTNVAANTYNPPAATNTSNSGPYDSYAANTTATNTYDYSGTNAGTNGGAANSYTSYSNTAPNTANTYAAANTNAGSSNNYYSGGGASTAPVTSNASASGSAAVQVFATVSQAKAERIRQDIASQGVNAIVDQVDGLFKVRVPYATPGEARANLTRVRHVSGTPGAFVTTR